MFYSNASPSKVLKVMQTKRVSCTFIFVSLCCTQREDSWTSWEVVSGSSTLLLCFADLWFLNHLITHEELWAGKWLWTADRMVSSETDNAWTILRNKWFSNYMRGYLPNSTGAAKFNRVSWKSGSCEQINCHQAWCILPLQKITLVLMFSTRVAENNRFSTIYCKPCCIALYINYVIGFILHVWNGFRSYLWYSIQNWLSNWRPTSRIAPVLWSVFLLHLQHWLHSNAKQQYQGFHLDPFSFCKCLPHFCSLVMKILGTRIVGLDLYW